MEKGKKEMFENSKDEPSIAGTANPLPLTKMGLGVQGSTHEPRK